MSLPQSYSVEIHDIKNPANGKSTFAGVVSDGIIQDAQQSYIPFRFLTLLDQSRIEFPMDRYFVRFSPERALIAEANQQRLASEKRNLEDAPRPKIN